MKIKYWGFTPCLIMLISVFTLALPATAATSVAAIQGNQTQATDRVIVKFKSGIARASVNSILNSVGVASENRLQSVGMSILHLAKGMSVKQALTTLQASGIVEYAVPDQILHTNLLPNDPMYSQLWGLNNTGQTAGTANADIDADLAWNVTIGDPYSVVGIIDTGIDYTHPDLAANIWTNPGEIPGNLIDDDGNGYIDDVHGINAILNNGDPMDDNHHGTHVAGTIGAVGNNGTGVVGVNHQVKMMGLKFLDAFGSGFTSNALQCMDYVLLMKNTYGVNIKLTSNSWGGGGFDPALFVAIQALDVAGLLFIAAAGNSASNNDALPSYPANYDVPNVISVAATDHNDILATFSNFGATTVDLAAPGVNIVSTGPANTYLTLSGTSMATPHVSGVAALIWASNPTATHLGVKNLILASTDPIIGLAGTSVTGGRLNAFNAVSCVPGTPSMSISPANGFSADRGVMTLVSANINDCVVAQTGATVTVTSSNGDPVFNLLDDGIAPDTIANDGIYTANWASATLGATTLNVSATGPFGTIMGAVSGTVVDVITYRAKEIPFQWIDASLGTLLTPLTDDSSVNVPVGFTFNHYGVPFTSVNVSSNGFLTFTAAGATTYSNTLIPGLAVPNDLIAPFWDDLNPTVSGQVYSILQGVAPYRKLTIEWLNIGLFGGSALETASFEVTLYESTDQIVVRYLDTIFGGTMFIHDNGASATVGVEDGAGLHGTQYSFNQPVLTDNSAILFTPATTSISDIKVNGVDGPVIVPAATNILATVALAPGPLTGLLADWWIWADTPFGRYWYVQPSGWALSPVPMLATTTPMVNLPTRNLRNQPLPIGAYSFGFAVEPADGVFDGTFIDWVDVTVQ